MKYPKNQTKAYHMPVFACSQSYGFTWIKSIDTVVIMTVPWFPALPCRAEED